MELATAAYVLWIVSCKAVDHEGTCTTSQYQEGRSTYATWDKCMQIGSIMEQQLRENHKPGMGWALILDFWCDVKE